ncbi:hypothetical protein EYF80_022030 [Liparis tanakae]|uniref:Uncharacterized protein n=1 Tax=Liparis tanakae TaxID=230148 RepID=A0A4Z2HRS8_9TELE|nr:hypothetical protein EYF80_022030 [Liparis tanakae]
MSLMKDLMSLSCSRNLFSASSNASSLICGHERGRRQTEIRTVDVHYIHNMHKRREQSFLRLYSLMLTLISLMASRAWVSWSRSGWLSGVAPSSSISSSGYRITRCTGLIRKEPSSSSMTFDLFSSILSSGSSVPAAGVESEVGVGSSALGWDDRSVVSGGREGGRGEERRQIQLHPNSTKQRFLI